MKGLRGVCLALPWLWLSGLHVADAAWVLFGLSLSILTWSRWRRQPIPAGNEDLSLALLIFSLVFPIAAGLFMMARIRLGSIGLDFTLFAQVVDSIGRTGTAWTSLLGLEWQNFLGHHLDLILWLPAGLRALSFSPLTSLVSFHVVALAFSTAFLLLLAKRHPARYFLLALFAILPFFRHALLWSIHDDVYALPLMAASWYFWKNRNDLALTVCLLLLCLCKETMGLWVFGFSVATWVWDRRPRQLFMAALGALLFIVYVFLQPLILGKSFDHISKISSLAQFMDIGTLKDKSLFFAALVCPFLILLWGTRLQRKDLVLLLPALPFLGMIGISNFSEMWRPLNYYGLIPSFTFLLFSIHVLEREDRELQAGKFLLIISLAFTSGTLKPGRSLYLAWQSQELAPPDLTRLPPLTRFALSPAAHTALLHSGLSPLPGQSFPGRALWFSVKGETPDLVLFKKGEEGDFPKAWLESFKPCPGVEGEGAWVYLCP